MTSVGSLEMNSAQEFRTSWNDGGGVDDVTSSHGDDTGGTVREDKGRDEAMAGTWIWCDLN